MSISIPCGHCGAAFVPARSDAKYCSLRCRVAAHRAKPRPAAPEPTQKAKPATGASTGGSGAAGRSGDGLSKSAQKKLDAEFEASLEARLKDVLETILPQFQDRERRFNMVLNAQKGVFPVGEYQKILKCLHPDTQPDAATRGEAFRLFTEKKAVLIAGREGMSNGSGLPATVAELLSRRKNKK